MYYLGTANNDLSKIMITFLIKDHSFLPADRVFGTVKKWLRETVATREHYTVYEAIGQELHNWFPKDTKPLCQMFKNVDFIS